MSESTWAPTPPLDSVQTLQKLIAGYVLMPTDDEVLEAALAGIKIGVDLLNTNTWNWTIGYDDIDFTEDETDYGLSSWFKAPLNFEMLDASNHSIYKLEWKALKTFLLEEQRSDSGDPKAYTCANVHSLGTVSLNVVPTSNWVAKYPTGRLWYYHRVEYPGNGGALDVPSEVRPFVIACGEAFVADRFAPGKAAMAYQRAARLYDPTTFTGALLTSDNNVHTDWQGE